MFYSESSLLPLSALQHLSFCERQCALIHVEQQWAENRLTVEGRILHERVHGQETEVRGDVRIVRGLRLRSLEAGLAGVADVVEFHRAEKGIVLWDVKGQWRVYPVEYKRGKPKADRCDEVQLCGQALCLEEMLGTCIDDGAFYYGAEHRRHEVVFDRDLRDETLRLAVKLHQLIDSRKTPPPCNDARCRRCSMNDICMPKMGAYGTQAQRYIEGVIDEESGR